MKKITQKAGAVLITFGFIMALLNIDRLYEENHVLEKKLIDLDEVDFLADLSICDTRKNYDIPCTGLEIEAGFAREDIEICEEMKKYNTSCDAQVLIKKSEELDAAVLIKKNEHNWNK